MGSFDKEVRLASENVEEFYCSVSVFNIGYTVSSPKGRNGMPAGHPFQGSQPKHLEEMNSKKQISLPRRPYLSQDSSKPRALGRKLEEKFDTEKMMRYDDFTDEDVGNIAMDAEPLEGVNLQEKNFKNLPKLLEPSEARESLLQLAKEINTYPGINEFDEKRKLKKTPYQTSGNRPVFARNRFPNRNYRPFRPAGGRNFPNVGGGRQFRRPQRRPHRRFPNRPNFQQPRRPQQSLRDTFDYEDETPDVFREDKEEVEYYDEEINFNEPESFENPPKKYKILTHNRPLRSHPGPGPSNVIGIVNLNGPPKRHVHQNHQPHLNGPPHSIPHQRGPPIIRNETPYPEFHGPEEIYQPKTRFEDLPRLAPPTEHTAHHNSGGGNSGFFKVPNDFPNLQDLTGGFSKTNRRRAYESPATPTYRRKRLLIALDPDFVQSQRLLSEKL